MHKDTVYAEVGKAIELIQIADRLFKSVLLLVFPGQEFNDLENMNKNNKVLDNATLGKLIRLLKKRVVLNDNFEAILTAYLTDRNSLVHNWNDIEGWEDESKAIEFIVRVQKSAAYLFYTFTGFMRTWMEQVGITEIDDQFPELEELFALIDADWKQLMHVFIKDIRST